MVMLAVGSTIAFLPDQQIESVVRRICTLYEVPHSSSVGTYLTRV